MDAGEVAYACIREDADLRVEVGGWIRGGCVCMRLQCSVLCECQVVCAICGEVDRLVRSAAGVRGDESVAAGSCLEF